MTTDAWWIALFVLNAIGFYAMGRLHERPRVDRRIEEIYTKGYEQGRKHERETLQKTFQTNHGGST